MIVNSSRVIYHCLLVIHSLLLQCICQIHFVVSLSLIQLQLKVRHPGPPKTLCSPLLVKKTLTVLSLRTQEYISLPYHCRSSTPTVSPPWINTFLHPLLQSSIFTFHFYYTLPTLFCYCIMVWLLNYLKKKSCLNMFCVTHILLPKFVKGTGQNHYMRVDYANYVHQVYCKIHWRLTDWIWKLKLKKMNFQAKKIAKIIHTHKLLSWDNTCWSTTSCSPLIHPWPTGV